MDEQSQPSCLNVVADLLRRCHSDETVFPPTDLYNEGWLLRITLDWFSKQKPSGHELSFSQGCTWFSEALLPSQFLARFRGDALSESWTHADGIIGHIRIGRGGKADTSFDTEVTHFVVTEAKIFSKLSAGVKNASYFNQAARYAACIAELLNKVERKPADLKRLGLYILAPAETIGYGWFERPLDKADIKQKVERRVQAYEGEKDRWFEDWFQPVLDQLDVRCLSWESILDYIGSVDKEYTIGLQGFYQKCLSFNRPANYQST